MRHNGSWPGYGTLELLKYGVSSQIHNTMQASAFCNVTQVGRIQALERLSENLQAPHVLSNRHSCT